jgi:hypothetical protein
MHTTTTTITLGCVSVLNYLICCMFKEVHLSDQYQTFCLLATSSGPVCVNITCIIELVLLSTVLHFVMPSE